MPMKWIVKVHDEAMSGYFEINKFEKALLKKINVLVQSSQNNE